MTQPYSPELHDQVGWLLGVPVFESKLATRPLVLKTPIPGTSETRVKLIVPNYKEFENEIWIEQTLHRIVSEQMGDTLEWLYGNRRWISPSSRYSTTLAQIQLANQWNTVIRGFQRAVETIEKVFAPTTPSGSAPVAGLSAMKATIQGFGSTPPPDVGGRNT